MAIHPTAVVDKTAELETSVEIGAYAIVEGNVRIGAGTRLCPHAYVATGTRLGARCEIHPFAVVGHLPQDLKFDGSPTYAEIGDETVVREHATVHRGTAPGSTTVVGRRCFLMSTAHIGHNCVVGDDVKMANGALLSGHVEVGPAAVFSAQAMVHQFARVGELVMVRGGAKLVQDVPPFMMAVDGGVAGLNAVGLRRAGFSGEEREELRECNRLLYRVGLKFPEAVARVEALVQTDAGRRLVEFLRRPSQRGYVGSWRRGRAAPVDEAAS